MGSAQRIPIDPDVGIPDLVRRIADDSKRLVSDEVRLAKLETQDSVKRAGKGAMWLGMAFGISVVCMVAFTLFIATLIGRIVAGHMWLGALIAAIIDLAAGGYLIKRGLSAFTEPSYSLEQTRESLKALR
jgi:uncharacterized membrane protein YqjE